jgi:hypothetical protein
MYVCIDVQATRAATRARQPVMGDEPSLGCVIVSLQQTQHDGCSSLRIFGTIDMVMQLLAAELKLGLAQIRADQAVDLLYVPDVLATSVTADPDVFLVPYAADGTLLPSGVPLRLLDLREDQEVTLTSGPHKGDQGIVQGKLSEGHYKIQFRHEIGNGGKSFKAPIVRILGLWWIQAASKGQVPLFPLATLPTDSV